MGEYRIGKGILNSSDPLLSLLCLCRTCHRRKACNQTGARRERFALASLWVDLIVSSARRLSGLFATTTVDCLREFPTWTRDRPQVSRIPSVEKPFDSNQSLNRRSAMSNLGLFQWIREGVKQSVLMGVSDAVEVIGTPDSSAEYHPALQAFAKAPLQAFGSTSLSDASNTKLTNEPKAGRKRLGRSLKDINPPKAAPPKSDV